MYHTHHYVGVVIDDGPTPAAVPLMEQTRSALSMRPFITTKEPTLTMTSLSPIHHEVAHLAPLRRQPTTPIEYQQNRHSDAHFLVASFFQIELQHLDCGGCE